jgi:hypothetical protein
LIILNLTAGWIKTQIQVRSGSPGPAPGSGGQGRDAPAIAVKTSHHGKPHEILKEPERQPLIISRRPGDPVSRAIPIDLSVFMPIFW